MNTTIAIAQHKGGSGKTTTAINVAASLRRRGYKVLLVDLDAQANLTESMGIKATETMAEGLTAGRLPAIVSVKGIDVLPASLDLAGAEAMLYGKIVGREMALQRLLEPIRKEYDFIIIDCAPSLGLLTVNALTAADKVLIPVQSQFLAVRGMQSLMDIIGLVKTQLNQKLALLGVVMTQYDGRIILSRESSEYIRKQYKTEAFKSIIRTNISLAEAPTAHQSIFKYAPKSTGAQDYDDLTKEILKRLKRPEELPGGPRSQQEAMAELEAQGSGKRKPINK